VEGWVVLRAGLERRGKSGPEFVLGFVTLFYSSILQLASSGFKLNKYQVLLTEDGGRLPKHVAEKIVCFI